MLRLCRCALSVCLPVAGPQYRLLSKRRINLSVTAPTASLVCPKSCLSSDILIYFHSQRKILMSIVTLKANLNSYFLFLSLHFLHVENVKKTRRLEIQFVHTVRLFFKVSWEETWQPRSFSSKKSKALDKSFPQALAPGHFLHVSFPTGNFCACNSFFLLMGNCGHASDRSLHP